MLPPGDGTWNSHPRCQEIVTFIWFLLVSDALLQGGHRFIQCPRFGVLEKQPARIERTNDEPAMLLFANLYPAATTNPLGDGGKHGCEQRVLSDCS